MGPRRLALDAMRRVRNLVAPLQQSPVYKESVFDMVVQDTAMRMRHLVAAPPLEVIETEQLTHRWDAIYRRIGTGYRLELPKIARLQTVEKCAFLGSAYLYWLMNCPAAVEKIVITLSDGDQPTRGQFAPATNQPHVTPIPDPYIFLNKAFEEQRQFAEREDVPWSSRSDDISWRGTSSGIGSFDPLLAAACPQRATQRILLCLAARDIEGVDVALSSYRRDEFDERVLRDLGLIKEELPENSWLGRKFAIDVDGQSNTWSNLIIRLHLGCCVLKVESRDGYRQWYYDRLRPWEHFVPVKADLSDLREQVEWVRANDERAREIAANGRALARTLTLDACRQEAVHLITAHWQESPFA